MNALISTTTTFSITDLPLILTLPILLVASGFFSGTETALFSLRGHTRLRLIRKRGMVGNAVQTLLSDQRALLITLLLGNMVINILYFVISSVLLLKLHQQTLHPLLLFFSAVLPLIVILLLGEILPKLAANNVTEMWLRLTAVPMLGVHRILSPLRVILSQWIITPLSRLVAPTTLPNDLSADELKGLIDISKHSGVIDQSEEQLLHEVMQLNEIKVVDLMVPRVDVHWIDINDEPAKLRQMIYDTRLTRYPVCNKDVDHIEGIIYTKQFLLASATGKIKNLSSLVRRVRFVPELQRVDQLLSDFRKSGTKVAIAVDEYGGTAGLVTLQDIVERLVGDLSRDNKIDTTDVPDTRLISDNIWHVSGNLSVRDWSNIFGQTILPPRVTTVGGLVMAILGHVPKIGDCVRIGNIELRVIQMDGWRVRSIELSLTDHSTGDDQ